MKPQRQTSFAGPGGETGELGNCWATCIAMLIEETPDSVPNFAAVHGPPKMLWWTTARRWLRDECGLDIACYESIDDADWPDPPKYVIAGGPSPRGDFDHAVVVDRRTGTIHDPHPSDDGLDGEATSFDVLVHPYDPDPETEADEMFLRWESVDA